MGPGSLVNQTVFREHACASEKGREGISHPGDLKSIAVILSSQEVFFSNEAHLNIIQQYYTEP